MKPINPKPSENKGLDRTKPLHTVDKIVLAVFVLALVVLADLNVCMLVKESLLRATSVALLYAVTLTIMMLAGHYFLVKFIWLGIAKKE